MTRRKRLAQLVKLIGEGQASPQDRLEAVSLIGSLEDASYVTLVRKLLEDDDSEVRYHALQTLVLDLDQKDGESATFCWKMVSDQDEYVGSMAATCLGSIHSGTRRESAMKKKSDSRPRPEWLAILQARPLCTAGPRMLDATRGW